MENIKDILKRSKYQIPSKEELESKLTKLLENDEILNFVKRNNLTKDFLLLNLAALTEYDSEEKFYQKTGSARAVPGFKPVLYLVNNTIQVEYIKTKEQREIDELNKAKKETKFIDIPKSIRNATLDNLEITNSSKNIINDMISFITNFVANPNEFHKGLYIWGAFGIGKTYMMGALVNELSKRGIKSIIVNTSTFIADLKNNFSEGNYVNKKIEMLQKVPFLVLDDIGAESISEWSRDEVIGVILQYRMQEELPTCFTSNMSFSKLEEHFAQTKTGEDQVKAKRIMERVYYLAKEYQLEGINKRH